MQGTRRNAEQDSHHTLYPVPHLLATGFFDCGFGIADLGLRSKVYLAKLQEMESPGFEVDEEAGNDHLVAGPLISLTSESIGQPP